MNQVQGKNHVVKALLEKSVPEARNIASSSKPYPHSQALSYPKTREWEEFLTNLAIGIVAIAVIVILGLLEKW